MQLTQGEPVEIHGVTILLKGTGYEHLADSRNASNADIVVTKAGERRRIYLERAHPGEPVFVKVFDVELALFVVDAYHQPSSAQVLMRR